MDKFDSLKTSWDNIYSADQQATVFVSWDFIRGWIATAGDNWLILSVRALKSKDYVAFIVLHISSNKQNLGMSYSLLSDHTSFICLPGYEKEAINVIAKFIQQHISWKKFMLQEVMDSRLDLFLECFSARKFIITELETTPCPYIPLGDTWDQYLADRLSQKGRKKLRKYLRDLENKDDLSITHIQDNNIETQIETLLTLWQMKWGEEKSSTLKSLRSIFINCYHGNHLFMPIIWSGTEPVSASVAFVDYQKKCLYDYIGGWDEKFSKLSPGATINAFGIRFATENGFEIYDFLRGSEGYKYTSFGAIDRFNRNILIEKKNLKSTAKKIKHRIRRSLF